jgi:ABC-type transporter Mla subunit MlaD
MSAELIVRPKVPTAQDRYQDVLDKFNYLTLKIENYDRLINDVSEVKKDIKQFLENSHEALETSKENKDTIRQLSSDIDHLRAWLRSESERFDVKSSRLDQALAAQCQRTVDNHKAQGTALDDLHQTILEKFMHYPTIHEVQCNLERVALDMECLKLHQDKALEKTNAELEMFRRDAWKQFQTSDLEFNKKLAILQNKFVRELHDQHNPA